MTLPCTGLTDLFFSRARADIDAAKALCSGCDVRARCLEEALGLACASNDGGGVWAGTEPAERRAIRRARQRASSPGPA